MTWVSLFPVCIYIYKFIDFHRNKKEKYKFIEFENIKNVKNYLFLEKSLIIRKAESIKKGKGKANGPYCDCETFMTSH